MKSVRLPSYGSHILPYYLAAEEWIARNLPRDEYFFAWQTRPTVICGRHQQMECEVDMAYCRSHGIEVYRRKSGGGCVYSDGNNVMFSYITPATSVVSSFGSYTRAVCRMLASLGIDARATGRNDIEAGGCKVAGNSFYYTAGCGIVHGTMLYDADPETMSHVLTPSRAKLLSKGVQSVPSRITTLRALGLDISCREFIERAVIMIAPDGEIVLDDKADREIEEIMQTYLAPSFYADKVRGSRHGNRVPDVGQIGFTCSIDADGSITKPLLAGDFFALSDLDATIYKCLEGCRADAASISEALQGIDPAQIILGLDRETLLNIILTEISDIKP